MSSVTRRQFLHTGSRLALAATLTPRWADAQMRSDAALRIGTPELKALIDTALAAATAAGAIYASAHLRVGRYEVWDSYPGIPAPQCTTVVGLGVRALVHGYWGFAGTDGMPSVDHAAQLGRDATAQATIASHGPPRTVALAPTSVVTGSWTMPVEIDPITAVSDDEKADFMNAMTDVVSRMQYGIGPSATLFFRKEEQTFGSSDGSFTSQTTYQTSAGWRVGVPPDWHTGREAACEADFLSPAGRGWEYIRTAPIRERAQAMIDRALGARDPISMDPGRYDIVFDAQAAAGLVSATIGTATELDRAMGLEANGVGTSFLRDPLGMLGTFPVGSPLLTVTANRTMPGGAATVRWDDEGVVPVETTLVKDGILADYQTTRESASWLAPYYQKAGRAVVSNGCAYAAGASTPLTQRSPNLVMQPGTQDLSFEDLVKTTKKGIAIMGGGPGGTPSMDFQALNGNGGGDFAYEIVNGALGKVVGGAFYFRTPDFWKNLVAIGGASSARSFGFESARDEWIDRTAHTVSAVPMLVRNVRVLA